MNSMSLWLLFSHLGWIPLDTYAYDCWKSSPMRVSATLQQLRGRELPGQWMHHYNKDYQFLLGPNLLLNPPLQENLSFQNSLLSADLYDSNFLLG